MKTLNTQNLRILKEPAEYVKSPEEEKKMQYEELCAKIFELADNEITLSRLQDILYNGKVGDYYISSVIGDGTYDDNVELAKRVSMAIFCVENPEAFEILAKNNINIFHGTNVIALPTILKYGLLSRAKLKRKLIRNTTGERWTRLERETEEISFTDILSVAFGYSNIPLKLDRYHNFANPTIGFYERAIIEGRFRQSFPIILGTTVSEIQRDNVVRCKRSKDTLDQWSHIMIMDHFPLEYIKCIMVPKNKVDYVRKLLGDNQILVLGIELSTHNAFRYDLVDGCIKFYECAYEDLKKHRKVSTISFSDEEVKKVAGMCSSEELVNLANTLKGGNGRARRTR